MTQQPPPPYGGPPGPPPGGSPYGQAPGQPPSSGMSNKAKFWLGAVLGLPAIIVGPLVVATAASLGQGISPDSSLGEVLGGLASLLLLAGYVAMVVLPRTRWLALGMLAGAAILLILAAGACIVLIAGLSNSYG